VNSLAGVVRTLRGSDARSRALPYLVHAALGAAIWFATVQVAARVVPVERPVQLAALGILVVLVVAAIAWIARRPGPDLLMQRADLHLGLKERLSTAWERRAADGLMDDLLRKDALQHALRDRLVRAFPIRINRREAGAVAIIAAAALALAVLPNAMDRLLAQAQADRASQAKAASTIHDVQNKIAASTKTAPVDPKVQKILSDTAKQIQDAKDPRSALEAISPAEQQLRSLSDPQTPARTATTQNLASALSTTNSGQAAAQALSASPSQGAEGVRNLAAQLPNLSPQERAQLAKALAGAAQSAKDPAMAASLQRASDALSSGDLAAAAAALNGLAGQLDSLQNQQNNDQQIASAINGLEAARQALAAQVDRDAAGSSAANGGAGASPAAGASAAAGSGNGNANANGNGTANGNGNGSGNGNSNGNGSGGSGGTGSSGSGSGTGTAAKPDEKVYVPGQPVPGQQENDPTPLGPGQDVPLTPYTQVIQSYQQAALDATSQSLIPGSEQDLVREYFARLGE
jgi:hypothetical protein